MSDLGQLDPTFRERTDAELIRATLEGDEQAFEGLVRRHQKRIYRVLLAIVRDDVAADMLTQDTFIRAYTNLSRFEGRSEIETWLTRIAINAARDHLRSSRHSLFRSLDEREGGVAEPLDERPDAERTVLSGELGQALARAVQRLSAQQRLIFTLRHYEDRSLQEIARILGLRSGTVRAHLFRAIHKIRDQLADWRPDLDAMKGRS